MEKMNREQSKSKVDESSSKSNSVLGRDEGFGSVSLNFEVGSSSSHSHVNSSQGMPHPPAFNQHVNNYHRNNLEEQQRHRLRYRRIMERMPRTQHTDPSSSSNTVKAPVYPPGSQFLPTDLGCVKVDLRNKVEKNKSGFITTLDLYKDDPWLLDHVHNDLFPRGEWYYFTPRTKRGAKTTIRAVRGSGGGTWKSTSGKEAIKDKEGKVQGYKQSLVYNKADANGDMKPTGWNMKEYCLHEENQDDLVLCHIKGDIKKKGFVEAVKKNNILSDQVQNPEEEVAGANGVEMRRTLQEDHQQQQQQEQDTLSVVSVPPPHDGQGLGVETTHNNDHNLMLKEDHGDATQQQQQQQQPREQDSGYMMAIQNNFMTMLQINPGDGTQQQQQKEQEQGAPPVLVPPPPPHEGQDPGFETMMNNDNNFMMTMPLQEGDHGEATQQQQEQDAPPVLVRSPHEGQDPVLEEMMNDESNFMTRGDADQQYQWDDSDLYINVDELFNVEEMMPMDDILQQPVSEARDIAGESAY